MVDLLPLDLLETAEAMDSMTLWKYMFSPCCSLDLNIFLNPQIDQISLKKGEVWKSYMKKYTNNTDFFIFNVTTARNNMPPSPIILLTVLI